VRDLFLERWIFKRRSSNCLGTDLDSKTTLQAISAVDCNSGPFGSYILSENVIVRDGNVRVFGGFLSQDSDTARTSGLAECAKAGNKTKLGRRLLMLTCMKPRLLRLQKSINESAWGMGVMLGAAGPGLTSTSQEEKRRTRIRVRLKAIRTGCLVHLEQRVKGAGFWVRKNRFKA
jgi:hypothetical protein